MAAVAGVLPLLAPAPGPAQLAVPPPPPLAPPLPGTPLPPEPSDAELGACVGRFGHTGCAARLYARLLCAVVGQPSIPEDLQAQLDGQYVRAGIDFRGITVEEVEGTAVRYYAPMLCPSRSDGIRELFAPRTSPAAAEPAG